MKIAVLGAGKMAAAIVHDLVANRWVREVVVGDVALANAEQLRRRLRSNKKIKPIQLDVRRAASVRRAIAGAQCVVGATTYSHNVALTKACIAARAHFCDLGGNNDVVRAQHGCDAEARRAGVTVIPDCGLAPGLVNVLAHHWSRPFDKVDHLRIRVGGLPQKPDNDLGYQLVFSVEGLINEYVERAEVLRDGKKRLVPGLTEVETLSFGSPYDQLEAFVTSGGISTLPRTLAKKVRNLDYKTIRYAGHAARFRVLMDLGLFSSEPVRLGKSAVVPRALTAHLLAAHLPHDRPDAVLMRIEVEGVRDGVPTRLRYDGIDVYHRRTRLTAMQRCTGFPVAIIAQMLAAGEIEQAGVVSQELVIPGERFLRELSDRGIRFEERAY